MRPLISSVQQKIPISFVEPILVSGIELISDILHYIFEVYLIDPGVLVASYWAVSR
jgi:hypothetical protein